MQAARPFALAVVVVCLLSPAVAAPDDGFALDGKRKVLAPIAYRNLALMPVVRSVKPAKPVADLLVLDEGMKRKVVEVIERDADGAVNELVVDNRSDQALFLMAGEVIIGGKQDRIIGKDTLIPARSREAVPVFCVEHGRWSGRKANFESAGALAHTTLRNKAKYENQSEVWGEVSAKNASTGIANDTDTYRDLAQGKKVGGSVDKYQRHFDDALARLPARAEMVGFVVVLNGKVVAIETFQSPELFRKLSGKLLASYYVEAVDQPVADALAAPTAAEVKGFVAAAAKARREEVHASKGAKTYQFGADGVVGSEVKPAAAAPDADAVYQGAYAQ